MKRTYFKTQMELAKTLIDIIDNYYDGGMGEENTIEELKSLAEKNQDLLFVSGEYGAIITHKLGKKRLRVLTGAISGN